MRGLALLLVAGLFAGCGGGAGTPGASDQAPSAAADAGGGADSGSDKSGCELLTDAEVGDATGGAIASHEEYGLGGCMWRAEGGMQLMLEVYSGAPATCEAQKSLGTGREEPVPGLGDSAQWKTSGALVVCAPRAVIRFNLDNSPRTVPEDKDALIKLARSVLDRL